jgi:hypothetical protein
MKMVLPEVKTREDVVSALEEKVDKRAGRVFG